MFHNGKIVHFLQGIWGFGEVLQGWESEAVSRIVLPSTRITPAGCPALASDCSSSSSPIGCQFAARGSTDRRSAIVGSVSIRSITIALSDGFVGSRTIGDCGARFADGEWI